MKSLKDMTGYEKFQAKKLSESILSEAYKTQQHLDKGDFISTNFALAKIELAIKDLRQVLEII